MPELPMGLTELDAKEKLKEFGPNAIAEEAPSPVRSFLEKLWSPIAWMLEAAILLQLGFGRYLEATVTAGLLGFNAVLGFIQEGRAKTALAALKSKLDVTALVRRDGDWIRLPASELVPGDVIRLPLGALVPADATVLSGSIMVDQSMLTGESIPVDANIRSQIYAGSLVRRGQAIAEVTATGSKTYFGRTAELVRVAHSGSTEQSAVFKVTRNLAIINGTIAIFILLYAVSINLPTTDLIHLFLAALLATVPAALPATFTLSAAFGAQRLAKQGVLLTRLSASHEAASMDVLCVDKTGTLTCNALEVSEVSPMPGFDRVRVLELAILASSEADQDSIDTAIRAAAMKEKLSGSAERLLRFVPFDPETRISEAFVTDNDGKEFRIIKGAFETFIQKIANPIEVQKSVNELSEKGNRVIAVAQEKEKILELVGLIALADPPRDDSARLISELQEMNVRTIMVTGDSPLTASAIANKVGIKGALCSSLNFSENTNQDQCAIFARVVPEEKYKLVKSLQAVGHVVGMCGDGTNDAPALRQAQIGIAVSSATDIAKAAAGMVITEPGLGGIVYAVREGRVGFQRLLTYTLNMLVKKIEIVLFLAAGLALSGRPVMTPALMVLMLVTNDFLAMSLTTDRPTSAPYPSTWRMRNIITTAFVLGLCKLCFSISMLALGKFYYGLKSSELQTLAFVTLVFGAQAVLYVVRERQHIWSSRPNKWILVASIVDIGIVTILSLTGTLMDPLSWQILSVLFLSSIGFAFVLDQIKIPVTAFFKIR